MSDSATPQSPLSPSEAQDLLKSLLHKEGSWVDWGQICTKLQQGGYGAETIFSESGLQKVQQNLVMVASQVYASLTQEEVSEDLLSYFRGPKSDVLYELRILSQTQRAIAAEEAYRLKLTAAEAKELAKAFQAFGYLSQLPEGFVHHPGDAVAYQCWKLARQKKDLGDRTRLIAKGLRFAHSDSARAAVEKLLTDLAVIPTQKAPLVPLYRQEADQESTRLIPVVGQLPLSPDTLQTVAPLPAPDAFGVVSYEGSGAIAPVPQWQAVLTAIDPIALSATAQDVSDTLPRPHESVLIVADRGQCQWQANTYWLVEQEGTVVVQWLPEDGQTKILGQVLLVIRPSRIFDENNLREPWQMDD